MRLRLVTCMLIGSLLLGGCAAQAGDSAPVSIKEWIGKFPSDKINGITLWSHPIIKTKMEELLGAERNAFVLDTFARGVNQMVSEQDGKIYFSACKAHDCVAESIDVFIDAKTNDMFACLNRISEKTNLWFAPGKKPRDVGADGCFDAPSHDLYDLYEKKKVQ